tara:strand:+ start:9967 stop:10182 length:216 start_codon:yes stop_codon:yes gene_type:complete
MRWKKRVVDVDGRVINYPEGYWEAVNAVKSLIDSMDEKDIDRSDMNVVVKELFNEAVFKLTFLPRRIPEIT